MTESQYDREREYIKQTNTLTVISDMDSSEETPPHTPRMTTDELAEDPEADEKDLKLEQLEKELQDLTAKTIEIENLLEQKNAALSQLQAEVSQTTIINLLQTHGFQELVCNRVWMVTVYYLFD